MPSKDVAKQKVSVIVPVFNGEKYLQECLDSIYSQTFQDYEILVINDGSSDDTPRILKENKKHHQKLRVITQKNQGQGAARNSAIKQVDTKYVLFVDGDDMIDASLLSRCIEVAEKNNADVVNYNWQMLSTVNGVDKVDQFNMEVFANLPVLEGDKCELFLQKRNYFSWDSLYRTDFLIKNSICFSEGQIYEDNEFIVGVASRAKRIELINDSLYTLRNNQESSSRTKYNTDKHYKDFILAMEKSLAVLKARTNRSSFYFAAYCLEKFTIYYTQRVPRKYRREFRRKFLKTLSKQRINPPKGSDYSFLRSCISRRVFIDNRMLLFWTLLQYKIRIVPQKVYIKKFISNLQQRKHWNQL